jgi:hypothetical protein
VPKQETAVQIPQIQKWPVDRLVFFSRNPRQNDSFEVIAAEPEKGAV